MNNKNTVLKFGSLILGIMILVIGLILLIVNNNDKSPNKDPENVEDNQTDGKQVYICQNEISDLNYTSYQIETIYVENGIVKKMVPSMKVVWKDKDIYNIFKNDKEYSEGKTFDNSSLTITFPNGKDVSLIEDVNGNKIQILFTLYKKDLNKAGYTCQEK